VVTIGGIGLEWIECVLQADDGDEEEVYTDSSAFLKVKFL